MPSTLDSVLAVKVESVALGGGQDDRNPTQLNPMQDAPAVAGVHVQNPSSSTFDKKVYVDRVGDSLRFTDPTTSHILAELLSSTTGQVGSHDALRDLQHFLAGEGPGPGFASGCVCSRSYSGPLLSSEVWYTSASLTTKIVGRVMAYPAGSVLPSSATYTVYSSAGAALKTLTDAYTYSGPLITSITRTWS